MGVRTAALVAVLAAGLAPLSAAAPELTVDRDTVEFGEVTEGVYVEHSFTLTNTGDSTLQLSSQPPGRIEGESGLCPCMTTFVKHTSLQPGASTELKVTFETWGYAGRTLVLLVEIESNDPQQRAKLVRLHGKVLPRQEEHLGAAKELYMSFRMLVDLRDAEAFSRGHLLGAVNIPFEQLGERLDQLAADAAYYLYDEDGSQAAEASQQMRNAGLRASFAVSGGLAGWRIDLGELLIHRPEGALPEPLAEPQPAGRYAVAPSRLARNYVVVVDVRSSDAFAEGHIPGALNMPPQEISAWASSLLPPAAEVAPQVGLNIWLVGEGDGQACQLAAELRASGHAEAFCLLGGFGEWQVRYQSHKLVWSNQENE